MQEDIDHRSVTLTVNATKMTGRLLAKLMRAYLAHRKNKKLNPKMYHGKQTVKQLAKQNQGMTNMEITDKNIKSFEKYAKKYGVDFALKVDKSETPPKHLVFFKARDNDAILSAFSEFSAEKIKKASKPSVLSQLRDMKEKVQKQVLDKVKNKSKEQSL